MDDHGALAALHALLASDPAVADREALGEIVANNATLRSLVDLVDVRCHRRARELNAAGDAESATAVLMDEGRRSGKEATAAGERDRVCEEHPELEDALASGTVSSAHLDVIARLTKKLTDVERADFDLIVDDLLAAAAGEYVHQFEQRVKREIDAIKARHSATSDVEEFERQRDESHMKRWTDKTSGMKLTLLAMDPLRDAQFHTVVDAHLAKLRQDDANAKMPYGSLQIDAVIAAVTTPPSGDRRIPEVTVHVDSHSAEHGRHDNTLCETIDGAPVPVGTVQRLCCEAIIAAVIIDPDGTTRQLCTEQRTANRAQRRALAAMYSTCAHPTCHVAFSKCRIHHVIWWTRGGTTVLDNLLPLCETHHHQVHEGGWNLTLQPDRTLTWIRPDGSIWQTHHSPNRQPAPTDDPPSRTRSPDPDEWRQPSLC